MKFAIGTKQEMTQVFDDAGFVRPATVVKVDPVTVTQIKNTTKDGYEAVQVGFGVRGEKNINKAQKKKGSHAGYKEFKGVVVGDFAVGGTVDVSAFTPGDKVVVAGISKAKGFQGVVKRHGFHGGPRTHGQKHSEREPGSIGPGGVQRVPKGRRMAGRMGGDRVTVKNLRVLQVDADNGYILISGAIPGRRGTRIEIRTM